MANPNWVKGGPSPNPRGKGPPSQGELEARTWLRMRCVEHAKRLDELTRSDDERVALGAVLACLDRSMGKPAAAQEDRDALAAAARPAWIDSLSRAEIVAVARKALVSAAAQTVDGSSAETAGSISQRDGE